MNKYQYVSNVIIIFFFLLFKRSVDIICINKNIFHYFNVTSCNILTYIVDAIKNHALLLNNDDE